MSNVYRMFFFLSSFSFMYSFAILKLKTRAFMNVRFQQHPLVDTPFTSRSSVSFKLWKANFHVDAEKRD